MSEKILADYRRKVGDFEVVDVVDETEIARLRKQIDVDVPLHLQWTWEYGSEVEELRALYERGKKGQWNAEDDLDWSTPLPRDEWFMPREGASLLSSILTQLGADEATCREAAWDEFSHLCSQLLHGEQAALQLCGQLTNACPTMDAKWYAGSQVIDEVRHVEAFSKFLARKMGVIQPIDPTLKVLLDKLLAAPTWKTKTLGMQTLFEGMAVGIMELVQRGNRNPLIGDMITRIHQDEARHAAGELHLRDDVVEDVSAGRCLREEQAVIAVDQRGCGLHADGAQQRHQQQRLVFAVAEAALQHPLGRVRLVAVRAQLDAPEMRGDCPPAFVRDPAHFVHSHYLAFDVSEESFALVRYDRNKIGARLGIVVIRYSG